MSEFTHLELRRARESHKIPRWQLARTIGVSEETLKRWEYGDQMPEPDDVGAIERALGERSIWHQWMMSHYDSYRERYSSVPSYGLTAAVIRTRFELKDVIDLQEQVERDVIDGKLDDEQLKIRYRQQLQEAQASIIQTLEELK